MAGAAGGISCSCSSGSARWSSCAGEPSTAAAGRGWPGEGGWRSRQRPAPAPERAATARRSVRRRRIEERGNAVPKYMLKGSYTLEGVRGLVDQGGSARKSAVQALIKGVGGKL